MYDNYQFLSDPAEYLRRQAVSCYLQQGGKYTTDIGSAGANSAAVSVAQAFTFDIVDGPMQAMGVKELRITGPAMPAPPPNPYNPKIIGNWIPYLGLPDSSDISAFGRIKLENVHNDYIFTYQMNGCNLVVIDGNDTFTYLFHEPTNAKWNKPANYSSLGNLRYRTSPNYEHRNNPYGIACGLVLLRRWFGRWFVIVQTVGGDGHVLDVDEVELP
ncbi:MAG: hypothetical protein ACRD1F_05570 [Terriglobales bacterium]